MYLPQNYSEHYKVLVHDEGNSIIEGDVIAMTPHTHTKNVLYEVSRIINPFGKPVAERPPILSTLERRVVEEREAAAQMEAQQEAAGSENVEQQGDGANRETLPQGLHKFGAINDEAIVGKRRTLKRQGQSRKQQDKLKNVKAKDDARYQKESLKKGFNSTKPRPQGT